MNAPAPLCLTLLTVISLAACSTDDSPMNLADASTSDAGVVESDAAADAGPSADSCFAGIAPGTDNFVNVLDLESADGGIRVLLARERGPGTSVGETYPYQLVRFAIEREGLVECITSSSALQYEYAHHNWDESVSATGSSTYQVDVVYSFDTEPPAWVETLSIDGGELIPLRLRTCETLPSTDLNHCLGR